MRFSALTFWGTLTVSLLLAVSGFAPAALAQAPAAGDNPTPPTTTDPATNSKVDSTKDRGGNFASNVIDIGGNILSAPLTGPINGIALLILALNSWILGIVGGLFNFAVVNLVFHFSLFFGNSAGLLVGWSILRDIGNILLLFGFVFIGIQTILNVGHFSVGKALPRLIIFAILLNFSLFVSEAVIDASNAFASVLYTQSTAAGCVIGEQCSIDGGIASSILEVAGIGTIFKPTNILDTILGTLNFVIFANQTNEIISKIVLTIFVTTAWVVLLAGAVLLISRAVALAIVMITSPIGFAGMAIPSLNELSNAWWKALINNALFAPVYLILVFISLKIMSAIAVLTSKDGQRPSLADVLTGGGPSDFVGGVLVFALLMGFMIAALMVAKRFGVYGADMVTEQATKWGGATTFGLAGFFGRRTVGAASNAGSRAISRTAFGRTDLGRFVAGAVGAGANKSFDVRGTGVLPKSLGGAGKVAKGGIAGISHAEEEKRTKWEKESKKIQKVHYEEMEQRMDYYKRRQAEMTKRADEAERSGDGSKAARLRDKAARYGATADKYHSKAENTEHGKRAAQKKEIEKELKPKQAEKDGVDSAARNLRRDIARLGAEIKAAADDAEKRADLEKKYREKTENYNGLVTQSNNLATQIKEFTNQIHENEMAYAESLEKTAELLRFLPLSIGKRVLRGAAIEIREEIKKSSDAKLLDMIKGAGKGGGAGPAHAPAVATATPTTSGDHH